MVLESEMKHWNDLTGLWRVIEVWEGKGKGVVFLSSHEHDFQQLWFHCLGFVWWFEARWELLCMKIKLSIAYDARLKTPGDQKTIKFGRFLCSSHITLVLLLIFIQECVLIGIKKSSYRRNVFQEFYLSPLSSFFLWFFLRSQEPYWKESVAMSKLFAHFTRNLSNPKTIPSFEKLHWQFLQLIQT